MRILMTGRISCFWGAILCCFAASADDYAATITNGSGFEEQGLTIYYGGFCGGPFRSSAGSVNASAGALSITNILFEPGGKITVNLFNCNSGLTATDTWGFTGTEETILTEIPPSVPTLTPWATVLMGLAFLGIARLTIGRMRSHDAVSR